LIFDYFNTVLAVSTTMDFRGGNILMGLASLVNMNDFATCQKRQPSSSIPF
jgi:hypothetical protein